jgi:hypothetical protein
MATTNEIKHLVEKIHAATQRIKQRLSDQYLVKIPSQHKTGKRSDPKSIWWGYFPVVLVSILGLAITIALFSQSIRWEKN